MNLTFVMNDGDTISLQTRSPNPALKEVRTLLEDKSGISAAEQVISLEGHILEGPDTQMSQFGVTENSVLLLEGSVRGAKRPVTKDSAHKSSERAIQAAATLPRAEISDVELSRQKAIMENLKEALDSIPEAFARVTMLYIPVELHGRPLKAMVGCCAQHSIISPECAEACGLTPLVNTQFAGTARGIGTAQIIGRIHSTQLKVGSLLLQCTLVVVKGCDMDLLLGLDTLKANHACIDLNKNVLRLRNDFEVAFLSEDHTPLTTRVDKVQLGGATSPERLTINPNVPSGASSAGQSPTSRFAEVSVHVAMDLGGITKEDANNILKRAGQNVDNAASTLSSTT